MAKAKASTAAVKDEPKDNPEASLFDAAALKEELKRVRDKHLKGAKAQLDTYKAERDALNDKIDKLQAQIDEASGEDISKTIRKPATGEKKRKSEEELAKDAKAVHEFVKTKGKEGATGSELKAKFGKLSLAWKPFVEKYGDGMKLRKTPPDGKANAVYTVE